MTRGKKLSYDDREKMMKNIKGQALVSLLVFMIVAITVTTAAVAVILVTSVQSGKFELAELVHNLADSGIENALIQLLRNPAYTGETMTTIDGSVQISVTGTNPLTITSRAQSATFEKTAVAVVDLSDNQLTVLSWDEVL